MSRDELRDLWRELEAPSAEVEPGGESDWLREAWGALEAPATEAPGRRVLWRRRARPALAMAAALLIAMIGALAFLGGPPRSDERPGATREIADAPTPDLSGPTRPARIERRLDEAGNLELRQGRVRLLLVSTQTMDGNPDTENDR